MRTHTHRNTASLCMRASTGTLILRRTIWVINSSPGPDPKGGGTPPSTGPRMVVWIDGFCAPEILFQAYGSGIFFQLLLCAVLKILRICGEFEIG